MSQAGAAGSGRLSLVEKLGYGLGDAASNLVFQTIVNFIAFYYTDVVGLAPALVGTLFLVVRVFDAVLDPVMGAVADRTRSRWGQFRPWLVWLALPFGASAVLTFATPNLGEPGTAIYCFVAYTVLMIFYTGVNIPYGAMAAAMTDDPAERTSLQSWRFALAMVGNMIVSGATLPLIELFGHGDRAKGYLWTMVVFAVLAVVMLLACFATTREQARPVAAAQGGSLAGDLKALWANDQWRVLAMVNFVLLIAVVMRGTAALYFVRYVLREPDLSTAYLTLGTLGGVIGSLFAGNLHGAPKPRELLLMAVAHGGLLAVLGVAGLIPVDLMAPATAAVAGGYVLAKLSGAWLDRVRAFGVLMVLQAAAQVALFFTGGAGVAVSAGVFVLVMLLNQAAVPVLWALMSDSVDYGHWKTGRRITGLNFSTILFALKMGVAVGGALAAWLLGWYGYVANAVQTQHAMHGIAVVFGLGPAAACLLIAVISGAVRLTMARMQQVRLDLLKARG
ncbi:glycoside-pentoside-hexuronide (GPH):cation symporter [Caulobacter endophyticus]|uniref:glycoside-pentoside-hexuronide (GPH):cation symporter n=1 Tax=Caulobacter endophyticus TaxID=2172652 RepID=UPI002410133E|nr:glycoside-pentoside-hexuronide (GPH):cation symporter [Caulobacter endophyticus]MDG2527212.1 glycoside-pentoside-hexuronide (GPH):cation symporter [Caulobacter endophyticus]